jgi:hypothetical protein
MMPLSTTKAPLERATPDTPALPRMIPTDCGLAPTAPTTLEDAGAEETLLADLLLKAAKIGEMGLAPAEEGVVVARGLRRRPAGSIVAQREREVQSFPRRKCGYRVHRQIYGP